ncbi:MAG TPA: hypothetical protein VEQ60_05995 [Longimicrobium sp.]|nr:hypothetical protein [Longimicrobium sp.]
MSPRSMHARSGRLMVAAAALAALAACADATAPDAAVSGGPLSAVAPVTLTLVSGAGAIGGQDAANPVSTDGGATFQPANIVAKHPSYAVPFAGSNWIAPSGFVSYGQSSIYRATFTLPAGFSAPSLAIQVHADNYAAIRLNGNLVGSQPAAEIFANFQDPAESFATANPAFFQAGTNVLEIQVGNFSGPTALDYLAQVTYTPVTLDGLCELTRQLVPHHGVANSLCVKLDAAARALARGNEEAARGSLEAYIHEVRAQRGKKIAPADADTLIALATLLLP